MWSEKCDSDLFFAKIVWMIHSRDYAWLFHRQFFFWSFSLIFSEWRMLILDYQVTYVCSRFVERDMLVLDFSSDVYHETLSLTKHFIKIRRLIKFDESDSSNLTRKDVISVASSGTEAGLRQNYVMWLQSRDVNKIIMYRAKSLRFEHSTYIKSCSS
jgi:hypothetical protein